MTEGVMMGGVGRVGMQDRVWVHGHGVREVGTGREKPEGKGRGKKTRGKG